MYEVIVTEPAETLLSIDFIERLALCVGTLGLSRRKTPDWLADVIFGFTEFGGIIIDGSGQAVEIDDEAIDRVHGRDGSFSCISALRRSLSSPRRRRPRRSLLQRLQLYDAAFKIVGRPVMNEMMNNNAGHHALLST